MSFDTLEKKLEKVTEAAGKLQEIITDIEVYELEKSIRFMSPTEREKLYRAVEISKTAKDPLV